MPMAAAVEEAALFFFSEMSRLFCVASYESDSLTLPYKGVATPLLYLKGVS